MLSTYLHVYVCVCMSSYRCRVSYTYMRVYVCANTHYLVHANNAGMVLCMFASSTVCMYVCMYVCDIVGLDTHGWQASICVCASVCVRNICIDICMYSCICIYIMARCIRVCIVQMCMANVRVYGENMDVCSVYVCSGYV